MYIFLESDCLPNTVMLYFDADIVVELHLCMYIGCCFYTHVQSAFNMHFDNLKLLLRLLATHIMRISVSTPLILTISILSDMHIYYVHVGCLNLLLRFSYIIINLLASFD